MSDRPVFNQISLVVQDMSASVAFYRLLGLEIPDTDPQWDPHHRTAAMPGDLDFDLDSVGFVGKWNQGWRGGSGVVGFRVSSREAVDEIHGSVVAAGYQSQQPPYDAFWGSRYAIVEDPDGNAVGIMSPPDSARRSAPPAP